MEVRGRQGVCVAGGVMIKRGIIMDIRVRYVAGILLATVVAILFLKFADGQVPKAEPSHLWEENNPYSLFSLPWWVASGALMGVVIGLSLFRMENQMQRGAILLSVAILLVAAILASLTFTGFTLTLQTYAIAAGIDIVSFFLVATLPALAGLTVTSMLTSRPARRSAIEIMPDELREKYLRQSAQRKRFALPEWLTRRSEHESSIHP
jgi:hypothetical protein